MSLSSASPSPFRFEMTRVESLPRLAWCARFAAGSPVVSVRHGPWVETFDGGFVEGAWDGPFAAGAIDEALALAGTGARLCGDGVVLAASTSLHDRLYLARTRDHLVVSNSLVFALVATGDEPDPAVACYADLLLEQACAGIRRERRALPSRRGAIVLHECANLLVRPDLAVERREKPVPPPPASYDDYVGLVSGAVGRVLANACDPARARPFPPLATVSRGYDSACAAALAARHGCRDAFTLADDGTGGPLAEDDGTVVAERLGLRVVRRVRGVFPAAAGFPEAELWACPPGFDLPMASAADLLEGRLLLTGRAGDDLFDCGRAPMLPDLRQRTWAGLGGSTMTELRLRLGFLHFAPLFIGWQNAAAVRRVSLSPEMASLRVGGAYDRPIPRRLLEDAGVPRALFGQRKLAGGFARVFRMRHLGAAARADYAAFLRGLAPPAAVRARIRLGHAAGLVIHRANRGLARASRATGVPLPSLPQLPERHRRPIDGAYLFHWGFHHVRPRYAGA